MKLTSGKKYFYLTKLQEGLDNCTEQVLFKNKWAELTLYIDYLKNDLKGGKQMQVNLSLYKELLEFQQLNLITQINTTKNFINTYKDWQLGSKMQQVTRKKSFIKNTEKLVFLENKLNVIQTALLNLEVDK